VYIGSSNGSLASLDQTNGHVAWRDTIPAAVSTSAVVTPQGVGVGGANGTIYNFSYQGKLTTTQKLGTPIDAITATDNIYIATTSAGLYLVRGADEQATVNWKYLAANTFDPAVVILNGEVFAPATNGSLTTFAIPGNPVY
jgi:outer membrane protein assembly factor BamB